MTHKYSSLKESQRFTEKERVTKREFSGGARGRVFTHIGGTDSQLIELLKKYDRDTRPCYYTAGMYGWNCDIYYLGIYKDQSCWFTWGNRPFGKEIEYSKLEDILKEITGIDSEDFEESMSWEKNNMLLKESLPVEDRHEYQKWQKDFEDNEISKRDAKRKQILEDKCGLYFNTIYSELDYVHIDNEALYGIVSESIVYKEDSCENRIGSIGGFPEGVYDVYTSFYEDNYDFKRHSSKENLVHFLESPFYVFFQDSLENEEDDMRRQLSKKGYRQLASLVNKKVIKCIPMTQRADNQEFEGFGVYFPLESLKDRDTVCDLLDAFYEMNTVYEENM